VIVKIQKGKEQKILGGRWSHSTQELPDQLNHADGKNIKRKKRNRRSGDPRLQMYRVLKKKSSYRLVPKKSRPPFNRVFGMSRVRKKSCNERGVKKSGVHLSAEVGHNFLCGGPSRQKTEKVLLRGYQKVSKMWETDKKEHCRN